MKITRNELKGLIREVIEESTDIFSDIDLKQPYEAESDAPEQGAKWKIVTPIIIDTYEILDDDSIVWEFSQPLLSERAEKFDKFSKEMLDYVKGDYGLTDESKSNYLDGFEASIEDVDGIMSLVIRFNEKQKLNITQAEKVLTPFIEILADLLVDLPQNEYSYEDDNYLFAPRLVADTEKDTLRDLVKYGDSYTHSKIGAEYR